MTTANDSEKYEICFVKQKTGEAASENLKAAFEAMHSRDLDPSWITEDACLKVNSKKGRMFILDPFEGRVYEHLKSIQCRIIGPLCVLSCLELGERLPKRPHPVYSVAMRRITVTCSNLDKSTREHICNRVQLLGGAFSKDLTKSVTHLIAGEVGSEKYHVAAKLKIPIMLPAWVDELWSHGQFERLHASDATYHKFRCPVFKGLSITVSQLGVEERAAVQKLVESNGGRYSGAMKSRDTTHLVLLEAKGDKYNFAQSWKLHCVKRDWLYDSISAGHCLNEKLYQLDTPESGPKRSTPIKDKSNEKLIVDCSAINASLASHLNETAQSDMSIMVNARQRCSMDALDSFNVSCLPKCGQFLDGCKIYLTGFKGSHLEKLRKIVNSGGGMRFSKFTDSISHVVCGDKDLKLLDILRASSAKPYVVNFLWLLQCCKEQKLIDEGPYICAEFASFSPHKEVTQVSQVSVPPPPVAAGTNNNTDLLGKDVTMLEDFSEIMKQYADNKDNTDKKIAPVFNECKDVTTANESKMNSTVNAVDDKKVNVSSKLMISSTNSDVLSGAKISSSSTVKPEDASDNIFAGMTFVIIGFNDNDTQIFHNAVSSKGGAVLSLNDCCADVAVVPLIWRDDVVNARKLVTSCWLQKCVEDDNLLPTDSNELFKPFRIPSPCDVLKDVVISISQYTGVERDTLMLLASALGATCQDYFVRRANSTRGLLPNTHLLLITPDGIKYDAAKKWKIPAVTKHWLLAAATLLAVPPVDDFLIGKQEVLASAAAASDSSKNAISVAKQMPQPPPAVAKTNYLQDAQATSEKNITDRTQNPGLGQKKSNPSKNIRVKELIEDNRRLSSRGSGSSLGRSPLSDKPYFDVSSILRDLDSSMDSNDEKPEKKNVSLSVGELIDKNLSITLKRLGYKSDSCDTDQSNDGVSDNCHHVGSKINGIFQNGKKSISPSKDLSKESILSGVIVCVSKKLGEIRAEVNEIVISLGGEFRWSFDETCTHYIFRGKMNDLTKEFREARRLGKKIVSPEWVHACRDFGARVDESVFPHTLKPGMSLSELSTSKVPSSSLNHTSHNDNSDASFASPKPVLNGSKAGQNGESSADMSKQLDELIFAAKSAKAGKRRTRQNANSGIESPKDRSISKISASSPHFSAVTAETKYKFHHIDGASSEPSQGVPITWDDPTGRLERQKIAAIAAPDGSHDSVPVENISPPSGGGEGMGPGKSKSELSEATSGKQMSKESRERKFMFTSLPDEERQKYSSIVSELGGVVSDNKFFDDEATHLILGQPIKNEKFLASVASGKWVLHKSYLEDSLTERKFLLEENYEWGSEETKTFISKHSASVLKMSVCPRRWRIKIRNHGETNGAFHGWKVALITDKSKANSYSKILKAGGAEVYVPALLPPDLSLLTHAFIEISKNSELSVDFEPLVANRVKCMKPEYLAYYLIEDPPPPESDYFHPAAKELWNDLNCSNGLSKRPSEALGDPNAKRSRKS